MLCKEIIHAGNLADSTVRTSAAVLWCRPMWHGSCYLQRDDSQLCLSYSGTFANLFKSSASCELLSNLPTIS